MQPHAAFEGNLSLGVGILGWISFQIMAPQLGERTPLKSSLKNSSFSTLQMKNTQKLS